MTYDTKTLRRIYDRTSGYCHLCGKKLSFSNYAYPRRKGAWEVEHSNPRVSGGSDGLNNLFPACIQCNRAKGSYTTRTARSWHGRRRAPLSREGRKKTKRLNAIAGGAIGGLLGALAGPWGAVIGAAVGAGIGKSLNPDS